MTFKEWLKTSRYKYKDPLKLEMLYCNNCEITSLKGIEKFKNLIEFGCSDNNLTSLKGIEKLTKLTYLYCRNNKLKSLKGIEKLTNLVELTCRVNNLTSLKEIIYLNNLKYISSEFTKLEHKNFDYDNFSSIKDYQQYLKSFYRKDKIKKLI